MSLQTAFGDMGQTDRLWLIRDQFIAGHSSCELRRHLDSVPSETPIQDVVDRAASGRAMLTRRLDDTGGSDHPAEVGSGSVRGLTPTVADGRRYPGSDTGSAPCRGVVTESGDRDTVDCRRL